MFMDMNQAELRGCVGSEPQIRRGEGDAVCSFVLGTEFRGKTQWHKVRAWRDRAEWCQANLQVGDRIRVIGPIIYPGSKGAKVEIEALQIHKLLSRGSPAGRGDNAVPTKEKT